MGQIAITECPRDAMQGIPGFIPTAVKAKYLQLLLAVGFDRLDFGSFVSPKAVPQMRDTAEVLDMLDLSISATKLLAIVANARGAEEAARHEQIDVLGFPFSVSETFQLRNTNSTISTALETVKRLVGICNKANKIPLVYLSMGFGNPYGDAWSPGIVVDHLAKLIAAGVAHFALADTVGSSNPKTINDLYTHIESEFPAIELGLHLHSVPDASRDKLIAGLDAGCNRFDTALRGFGGCPMAVDKLTGNMATETLLALLDELGVDTELDMDAWAAAMLYSRQVFN